MLGHRAQESSIAHRGMLQELQQHVRVVQRERRDDRARLDRPVAQLCHQVRRQRVGLGLEDLERLDRSTRAGERLMLELRLLDGIAEGDLEQLLQGDQAGQLRRAALSRARADGMLETVDGRVRLTQRGLLLADSLLCELV